MAGALIPADPATAGAAEVTLMLMVTDQSIAYWSPVIADILTGEGWRTEDGTAHPRGIGWLTGEIHGRLDFLKLTGTSTLTTRSALTPTGRSAAIAALRHHAHPPRHRP